MRRATGGSPGVLVEAYRRGCCFDGWDEQFRYDTWLEVFRDPWL